MRKRSTYLLYISALAFLVHCWVAQSLTKYNNDESALLAFKASVTLEYPNNNILIHNWSARTSYCNWIGVSCSRRSPHQRVTALNLPNMGLRGTIAPQLGNLSFLIIFNIENNSFHGQIPDELGNLRRLKLINLRYNQLTGSIPTSIRVSPNLRRLILSNNNFTGTIPASPFNISKPADDPLDSVSRYAKYLKPTRPSHSTSPGHSDPNKNSGEPHL